MSYASDMRDIPNERWRTLEKFGFSQTKKIVPIQLEFTGLPSKHGSEGIRHRALKKMAGRMLVDLGEKDLKFEFDDFDVYGKDLRIVVECGSMSIEKLFKAFIDYAHLKVRELWNLSYPKAEAYCILNKFRFQAKPCPFIEACKPGVWSKSRLRQCSLNGANCLVKRQYLQKECLHLTGHEALKKNQSLD